MTPEAFARAYEAAVTKLRERPTLTLLVPTSLEIRAELRRLDVHVSTATVREFAVRYGVRLADLDE